MRKFGEFTVSAALTLLMLLLFSPSVFAATELSYDDGTPWGSEGLDFTGVLFSLPTGVSYARLLKVRYQWSSSGQGATLNIHITKADHQTKLTSPIPTWSSSSSPSWNELDISGRGILVSGDFYVVLENTADGNAKFDQNPVSPQRSFGGSSLATLTYPEFGDYLIRVVIEPTARPVGGILTPVNKLDILAPYLALLGLVGAVTVAVATTRRRKP